MSEMKLPVHGFVLAGGKSSRMGSDKALLRLGGKPLVELAVEKLRSFCADVSIAGNRDDLGAFAPVVREARVDAGPGAGIEAGLGAARWEWCLFVPVDVPLVPVELLRRWASDWRGDGDGDDEETVSLGPLVGSYLFSKKRRHPSFCMLRRSTLPVITRELDRGVRRLEDLWSAVQGEFGVASMVMIGPSGLAPDLGEEVERWFLNVNTPLELEEAEGFVAAKPMSENPAMGHPQLGSAEE